MNFRLLLLALCTSVLFFSCGSDPGPLVCVPRSLQLYGDSIVFEYNDHGKVGAVIHYDVLKRVFKRDDFAYNTSGSLDIVEKTVFPITGGAYVEVVHTLSYDDQGRPSTLISNSAFSGSITTQFTHDAQGRLTKASSSSGSLFLGHTRYEYDEAGNIPKVFYGLNLNGRFVEVLARENLSFDDQEKFYSKVPELKTCNEYVYSYLPNRNNCLGAKVYYYSYLSRFVSPLSITFSATYNDQGLISSLGDNPPNTNLYSSEILFERVLYRCDQ